MRRRSPPTGARALRPRDSRHASKRWSPKSPSCGPPCATCANNSECHNPDSRNSTTVQIMPLASETHDMDLAFTPEEQKFREEIRSWVRENLPQEISHKVHNALHL